MASNNTAALSLPKAKMVRGYEISRLALGGYLQALQTLQTLPDDLMSACFPGQSIEDVLAQLKHIDAQMLQSMVGSLLLTAPAHIVRVTARLTGIDEQTLLDDPDIGLDGLVALLEAWLEVNNLEDFIPAVRRLIGKGRTALGSSRPQSTGSKG